MSIRRNASIILAAATLAVSHQAIADSPADAVRASLQNYFASWNEPDTEKRRTLLATAWTDNATYTDPTAHVVGRAALVKHIDGFLNNPQMKGFSIEQASEIDIHHQAFRFQWEMKDPSGNTVTAGIDYGEFNDDGEITKIVGFFGPFPPLK